MEEPEDGGYGWGAGPGRAIGSFLFEYLQAELVAAVLFAKYVSAMYLQSPPLIRPLRTRHTEQSAGGAAHAIPPRCSRTAEMRLRARLH